MKWPLCFLVLAALATAVGAQPPAASQAQPARGQMPTLGRPTDTTDKVPPFDFDYFLGKWAFEWEVPEGALGPAGKIAGTTVYKKIDDEFYEAETDASGPAGALRAR